MPRSLAPIPKPPPGADRSLAITALYTSETWRREGVPGADLLATPQAAQVFGVTNGALGLARLLGAPARWLRRVRWSPLRVALAQRHALIDRWTRESDAAWVLELASGLSPRGLTEIERAPRPYVEVDQPEVLEWKEALLRRSPAGAAALERAHWHRAGADLRSADLRALAPGAGAGLVVAEGLLMYLDADAQRSLFRRVAEALPEGGLLVFDLVPPAEEPPPGLLGTALGWLMRRATRGADFARGKRTRADVLHDLEAAGFRATAVEPAAVATELGLPHAGTWCRQVVFRGEVGRRG